MATGSADPGACPHTSLAALSSTADERPIKSWMLQLLGIGVLVMIVADGIVGSRLLMLARRTRRLPELCFGLSFLSLGVLGYPLSIVARKAALAGAPVTGLLPAALFFQDLAALSMFVATWQTFRSGERWPSYALGAAIALFAASLLGDSWMSQRWMLRDGGAWYELGFWARACAYLFATLEAGRYYAAMRRRLKLGLADPVVTDRFKLWTISSSAISTATLIFYLGRLWAENVATSVPVLAATSLAGLIAGMTVWLAFVPPDAYLQHVRMQAKARA